MYPRKKIQVLQWIQYVYTLHEILDNVFAPKNWHVYILLEQYFNKIYVLAEVQQVIFLCHYMIPPKKPKNFTRYTTSNTCQEFVCLFSFLKNAWIWVPKSGVNKIYKIWGKGLRLWWKVKKNVKTYLSWQYAEKHIIMLLWFLWQSLHYDPNIFHSYWTHPLIPAPNSVSSKPTDFVLKKKI